MSKTNNVSNTNNGVIVSFSDNVKKANIIKIVDNCNSGGCSCMPENVKNKIKNIEVTGIDNNVNLEINGDINKEDIESALKKSTMLK